MNETLAKILDERCMDAAAQAAEQVRANLTRQFNHYGEHKGQALRSVKVVVTTTVDTEWDA